MKYMNLHKKSFNRIIKVKKVTKALHLNKYMLNRVKKL
jgi:hypothetical protein